MSDLMLETILGAVIFSALSLFVIPAWWSSSLGWKGEEKSRKERSKREP